MKRLGKVGFSEKDMITKIVNEYCHLVGKVKGAKGNPSSIESIIETIKLRRSIRRYSQRPIPEDVLMSILDAARWAPSAHNAQPWRFVVLRDRKTKHELITEMARAWEEDLIRDGIPAEERRRRIETSILRFTNAPVIIVACLTMRDMHKYPDKARQMAEYIMGIQSVAVAIQNLLLAAHDRGLGSCWFCAPLFAKDVVRQILDIPEDVDPQAFITVGYPAERPTPPARKKLDEIVYYDKYGKRSPTYSKSSEV